MIPVTATAAIPSTNCVSESALHQYEDVEKMVQATASGQKEELAWSVRCGMVCDGQIWNSKVKPRSKPQPDRWDSCPLPPPLQPPNMDFVLL